ncbi:unnamed protein product [Blepharisma stoltei]|uniref:Uncharacterized protein n=1 Tax=Blepharisma stoltei TaxID=1481888 RepID=A0AAU9JFX3_9CILI|nr:unnamed protein product [Blepharisma stoltei]
MIEIYWYHFTIGISTKSNCNIMGIIQTKKKVHLNSDLEEKPSSPDFLKARKAHYKNEYVLAKKALKKSHHCESDPDLDEYQRLPQRKASFVEPTDAHDEESKSVFFEKFTKKTQVEEFTYAKKELIRLDPKLLVSPLCKDNGGERKRLSLDNLLYESSDIKRRYSENIIE